MSKPTGSEGYQTPEDQYEHSGRAAAAGNSSWLSRHKLLASLVGGGLILAIALGVGLGVGLSQNNSNSSNNNANDSAGSGGGSSSTGGGSSGGTPTSSGSAPTPTATTITPLPKWDLTDPNNKMYGISLGNWLLLERWMDEDWMVETGGSDAWDEWTFTENLGDTAALAALQEHWNTWVTEEELDAFKAAGMNTVRIPVGYWAFVPAAPGEPYLAMSGQKEQMDKVLGWLYDRGMYASIDLHGMPGSQNGDQASGHNTSNVEWFTAANQRRSIETLNATIEWIQASPYSSIVGSIGLVNEPRPSHYSFSSSQQAENWEILRQFYETGYQICLEAGIPALFHHGFYTGPGTPADYWRGFATGKDPQYLGYEDHPYPGWFSPNNGSRSYMENNACAIVQGAVGYPVPMIISEWSSINGVYSESWTQEWTNIQLAGYAWSGGSVFWSGKVMNSTTQILSLPDELQMLYSAISLIQAGILPQPSSPTQTNIEFLSSLPGADGCGTFQTDSWSNPSRSGASYSGRRRRDSLALDGEVTSDSLLNKRVVVKGEVTSDSLLKKRAEELASQ